MKPNHYPLHPGAQHPPTMCMEIPIEEYESIKRENAQLKSMNAQLEDNVAFWKAKAKGTLNEPKDRTAHG